MRTKTFLAGCTAVYLLTSGAALACDLCDHSEVHTYKRNPHSPIGVMGDHMHEKGEFMMSYRAMHMGMGDLRDGTNNLSISDVLATANSNAPPANLRVVPTDMDMNMQMLGAMYGLTDDITVMGMLSYVDKDMESLIYNMAGTNIGGSHVKSSGIGDSKISAMVRLYEDTMHHVHLNAGFSVPTGSIKEADTMLMPSGMSMRMRLGYGMQLGTGTYDLLSGLTYTGVRAKWNWGAQYMARIPLESENSQGYRWGDKHMATIWGGYQWSKWLNTNARLSYEYSSKIHGADSMISGAAPGADPENYGGRRAEAGLGFNITPPHWGRQYFSVEATAPIYQDLNGPQMARDYTLTAGYTITF